jgi:16S rRNA (cytosine1402-N4)-methyltransferase
VNDYPHTPVLLADTIAFLDPQPDGRFIDCTVNGGGHSAAILERTGPGGPLLALDADPDAVEQARLRLSAFGDRAVVVHANFRYLREIAVDHDFADADGVLMDLGLSAGQLERSGRGFSFLRDEPLDMRFDPTVGRTAADYVASVSPFDLEQDLRALGEEPHARRIASAITAARRSASIRTTGQLVGLVLRALGGSRGRIHPATRTFQALRIAINDELRALSDVLPQAIDLLRRGGRVAVISFHSLEDRIVKTAFGRFAGRSLDEGPRGLPVSTTPFAPRIRIITRRPVTPSPAEVAANPRSRSAKLRVAERL